MTKWVYSFGGGEAEGRADMKQLLGGKGANLAEMANLGIPVPAGFTISTEACAYYYKNNQAYPEGVTEQVDQALARTEEIMGGRFGDADMPLLVSVRSGAPVSMPGMMDTVLNLGLNDTTVKGLVKQTGDERFAYDSYRRFIQMYADVVLGVDNQNFEEIIEAMKEEKGVRLDVELDADDLKKLVERFKAKVKETRHEAFPEDPRDQLWGAIGAVFGSWMNDRAETYRRLHNIPVEWGTAANVQSMVFGNMGEESATGVAFTRDPSTGENRFYGEYLINAQGEDVVAGIRTPQYLGKKEREEAGSELPSLEEAMPTLYQELVEIRRKLEERYKDMQDMEFTIQRGRVWMLQTRAGKRTAKAALKIAVDMAREGLIDEHTAVNRLDPAQLDQLLHPTLDPDAPRDVLGKGLPASPGAASGRIVFSAGDAEDWVQKGEKVMLVRQETSPDDIGGMHVAQGIVTTRGGMTSHAAVVARGMGRPCVAGAGELRADVKKKTLTAGDRVLKEGDTLTIDGTSGEVIAGAVPTVQPEVSGDFAVLMAWVDRARPIKVRANADTPEDLRIADQFGAEGVGLCRTEHMFFDPERIVAMRQMILAADERGRRTALEKLLPYQRDDFEELLRIMGPRPLTVRQLDPPLHEFLPNSDAEMKKVAEAAGVDQGTVQQRANQLREANPMLGHRGCRLGITYPEIYEMQARAIFEAACNVVKKDGTAVRPEVMIPLVATHQEVAILRDKVDAVARQVFEETGTSVTYHVGTMIELPRAALRGGEIAQAAEFFSFGTNDLTQTGLGMSRDDSGPFLGAYQQQGIFAHDPFMSLDQDGVGELVQIASWRGREARPGLELGICGEHGGDPASIAFCYRSGLDYVSCSPYRVPIARLAAAQAALAGEG